jgi:hypothetical protein
MIGRLLWIACLSVAFVSVGWAKEKSITGGWVRILPSGGCELNEKEIQCDRVVRQLRSMRLSPGFWVNVVVDGAPYEPVAALLDSLEKNGINNVHILPPFLGTTPSNSVKHWIKFVVEGVVNHPFPMVMITTERFKTWRERLIVLPASDFAIVDGLAKTRIGEGGCAASVKSIPRDLLENEHRLLLFEHDDDLTQSCWLPRTATSCEFLSAVMGLANVGWGPGDLQAIRSIAGEIGCDAAAVRSPCVSRTAVNPSAGAAGKTSCFSRSVKHMETEPLMGVQSLVPTYN